MKTSILVSASVLLLSATVFANPVRTVEELHAQAIGDSHVRLTYTTNYDGDLENTYGTSHSPWVQAGSSSRDLGSGLQNMPIMEMCDCHVPTGGNLVYTIVHRNGTVLVTAQVSGPDPTLPSTLGDCEIPCQMADADAADAGRKNDGGAPVTPSSNKGCTFVAPGTSPVLLGLALLGLGMAARRRRR